MRRQCSLAGKRAASLILHLDSSSDADPQQRLLLEVTWEALERAAIAADHLYEARVGVFLGMAMFRGGRPNLPGTVLGVILLRVLENGLNFTDINDYIQSAITGLVIVIAVLPPAVARLRASR